MLVRLQYPRIPGHVLESLFVTENVGGATKFPAMDIEEHENEMVVISELPGVKKDQVKVTFEKGILTVEGERTPFEIPQDAKILLNEMRVRNFHRSITIDVDVDADNISATLENGILRVILPKAPAARVRTISVK
jgi:HSP20 family protein